MTPRASRHTSTQAAVTRPSPAPCRLADPRDSQALAPLYWLKPFGRVFLLLTKSLFCCWQISYAGGLISYAFSMGTKACVTAADLIDSE